VDGVTVPNPHLHSQLVDATETQRFLVSNVTATLSFGASGAAAVANSSLVIHRSGNNIINMLAPNANTNQLLMGVVADNDWAEITSDYTAGTLRIARNSIGCTLSAESFFIDNHNDNANPINGNMGVLVSTNLVKTNTPDGGPSSFLVMTHVDFAGVASGGRTELFLGTSNLTGAASLLSLGTRNDAAGAPAGYGAYSFISNGGTNHISFEWTAANAGDTARVYARVIMFPHLS
jgi:hypothetical protein